MMRLERPNHVRRTRYLAWLFGYGTEKWRGSVQTAWSPAGTMKVDVGQRSRSIRQPGAQPGLKTQAKTPRTWRDVNFDLIDCIPVASAVAAVETNSRLFWKIRHRAFWNATSRHRVERRPFRKRVQDFSKNTAWLFVGISAGAGTSVMGCALCFLRVNSLPRTPRLRAKCDGKQGGGSRR